MDRPEGFMRVAQALAERGHPHRPRWLDVAARTAQEAADALKVQVGQIAKSVVFRRQGDGMAVLVVTSGDRRVDEHKVAAQVGALGRADAEFVKSRTGFSIGGVAPLAHVLPPVTLIDRDLFRFDLIWAAAGHPNGVFCLSRRSEAPAKLCSAGDSPQADAAPLRRVLRFGLSPAELAHLTGAPVCDVTPTQAPE